MMSLDYAAAQFPFAIQSWRAAYRHVLALSLPVSFDVISSQSHRGLDVQRTTFSRLDCMIGSARDQGLTWLVVDTPPRAGSIAGPVAVASDLIFVPLLPAVFDVRAIRPTLVEIYRAGAQEKTRLLLTLCPPRQGIGNPPAVAAARKTLIEAYGEYFRIAPCSITRYEAVRAALETSRTVIEAEPASKAASELEALRRFSERFLSPTKEPLAVQSAIT